MRFFKSFYQVKPICDACQVRFERDQGSFFGPALIAYSVALLITLFTGVLLYIYQGYFKGFEYILIGIITASIFLTYRPIKAWWVWFLWITGLVIKDSKEKGK